ncbi:sulfotransferase family cytosolic 2B member 1-like [Rhinatrema bivittatum]|uniref:sulfotransferase family cytosolic 2B member 1-like n=1 Tax=Rhinatrema bivittatum TaxID=194408 RepID=UPI0011264A26|nr:sulfotransferase family cytosolic 2B member 1-like [Rhinatrema bivittatum]
MQRDAGDVSSTKPSLEFFHYKGVKFTKGSIYTEENLRFVESEFQVQDDDVYNVTYPKSGTTWMLQILSLIYSNGDPARTRTVPNWLRSPWYETTSGQKCLKDLTPPRLISSHLPSHIFAKSFFTSKAKVIYTLRNPKDVLVSLYHFAKIMHVFEDPGNFDDFLDVFLRGDLLYGSWFDHVRGWMQMKGSSNVFFITYEELQQDLRGSVVRICDFLGRQLDEAALDSVVENATFKAMKDNKMASFGYVSNEFLDHSKGSFMRKGISGDWKNHFTIAQCDHFHRVYREKMRNLPVKFSWDEDWTEEGAPAL